MSWSFGIELSTSESEERPPVYGLRRIIFTLLIIVETYKFFPKVIPFDFFRFLTLHGSLVAFSVVAGLDLLIGTGVVIINLLIYKRVDWEESLGKPKEFMQAAILRSIIAGIGEEILFRWLFFFAAIPGFVPLNWLCFGGLQWVFVNIIIPFVDWISFGQLHHPLYDFGWAAGAALIVINREFRDGHSYQGIIGWANAWVGGMFYFYCMFTFGLWAAIVLHTVYNLYVSSLYAIAILWRKNRRK